MFTFTISEKSHKFEGEWEGVFEGGKKWKVIYFIISKIKLKKRQNIFWFYYILYILGVACVFTCKNYCINLAM